MIYNDNEHKNICEDLERLRDNGDAVQYSQNLKGFLFLSTQSHGYLFIPKNSLYYNLAKKIKTGFSYSGSKGIYLEEDEEAGLFLERLPKGEAIEAEEVKPSYRYLGDINR